MSRNRGPIIFALVGVLALLAFVIYVWRDVSKPHNLPPAQGPSSSLGGGTAAPPPPVAPRAPAPVVAATAIAQSSPTISVKQAPVQPQVAVPGTMPAKAIGDSAREIAKRVSPSVVLLVMEDSNGQPLAMGSGFVVKDGIVATNLHVVEGASRGYAKLADRTDKFNISGTVATDAAQDIVLLGVEDLKAPALTLGDSKQVSVGDEIYAVGNPRGLEGTFSAGIISSIRTVGDDTLLQITAPISPGSSGGPVVNSKGEVVGVSVATIKDGQNLNFAIPSSYLTTLMAAPAKLVKFAQVPPQAIMVPAPAPKAVPHCVNAEVLHVRFPLIDTTEGVFEARPTDFLDVGHRYLLIVAKQRILVVLELPGSDKRVNPLVAKLPERCVQDCREKGYARAFIAAADCEDKEVIRLKEIAAEYDAKAATAEAAAARAAAAEPAADAKVAAAKKTAAAAMTAADNAAAFYRYWVNWIADANANLEGMFMNTEKFQRANNQTLRRVENDYMAKTAAAKTAVAEEAAAIAAYRNEVNARMAGGAEGSRLRTAASDSRECAAAAALNAAIYRAAATKAAAVEPDKSAAPKE